MPESMSDLTLQAFLEDLSSKSPVPGGGGAAALGAALGAGLMNMVSSLTVGKKKYAEHDAVLRSMLAEGLDLMRYLLTMVDEDARVFAPLSEAYGLPALDEEQKAFKAERLSAASVSATEVPLAIAEKTFEAMQMCRKIAEIGSALAVSDAGCAILFLNAALNAARYNILINLPAIKDEQFARRVRGRIEELCLSGAVLTAETSAVVTDRL